MIGAAFVPAVPSLVRAQGNRQRPVQILLPFPSDVTYAMARLLADSIAESVGQPVVIAAKPGATGRVAGEALKNAAPDGSTLALFPLAVPVIAPIAFRQLRYDPVRDFAPVAQIARFPYALAIAPDVPAQSVPEFIDWARRHPDQSNFGTPGAGTIPHLFGVMIHRATGVELLHVPYKTSGAMASELMGRQISSGIDALANLIELHRAGRVRIIATTDAVHSPLLPSVRSFVEQGLPGIEGVGWIGAFVPARTPKALVDQLSRAMLNVLHAPKVRAHFARLAVEVTGSSPEELAAIIRADTARWAPILKASGFAGD